MVISIRYSGYNQRRYSRPWIARVSSWPVAGKAELEWGRYEGDDDGGEVVIQAAEGDIIRHGQRDNRGGNTSKDWYIVTASGELASTTESEGHKHFMARTALVPA